MKKSPYIQSMIFLLIVGLTTLNGQEKQQQNSLYQKIDNYLTTGTKNGFSGAISVVKNGKLIINKGYGLANKKTKILNNPNTIFDIGSNTKQFTATAILKLVELDKLKLSDSLCKFFKKLPANKQHITIHQLLSHSAGFLDALGRDFTKISQETYFTTLFESELLFKPGSKYAYSNAGYSVLGRIIELVSNQSYEAFLKKHLFTPAGMLQTGYILPTWNTLQISRGYNRNVLDAGSPIIRYQEDKEVNWHLKGNGGINSTQNDMLRWLKALKSNKIISKESFQKLTTAHISRPGNTSSYGYGWSIKNLKNQPIRISHNGSNGSFSHSIIWYPSEDLQIIYATNTNSPKIEFLGYTIAKIILKKDYAPKPIQNNIYSFIYNFTKNNPVHKSKELFSILNQQFSKDFTHAGVLNIIGNIYIRSNKNIEWALKLFKHNVELFPENGTIWDSLGDGYKVNNLKKEAIESYKKAISLGYKESKKKLSKLK